MAPSDSDLEMTPSDRAKFARGGVFLLLGGVLVVAFALAAIEPTPELYAGLVGASLALIVGWFLSRESVVRSIWFAPAVAALGMYLSTLFPSGPLGVGAVLVGLGLLQLVTAGLLRDN